MTQQSFSRLECGLVNRTHATTRPKQTKTDRQTDRQATTETTKRPHCFGGSIYEEETILAIVVIINISKVTLQERIKSNKLTGACQKRTLVLNAILDEG